MDRWKPFCYYYKLNVLLTHATLYRHKILSNATGSAMTRDWWQVNNCVQLYQYVICFWHLSCIRTGFHCHSYQRKQNFTWQLHRFSSSLVIMLWFEMRNCFSAICAHFSLFSIFLSIRLVCFGICYLCCFVVIMLYRRVIKWNIDFFYFKWFYLNTLAYAHK